MRRLAIAPCLLVVTVLAAAGAASAAALPASAELSPRGLGPIRLGMTEREIERATGLELGRDAWAGIGGSCSTATFGHRNYLLFRRSRLARISVGSRRFATTRGIHVGARRRKVVRRYGDRVRRSPHAYTRGEYLDVGRRSPRRMFETAGRGRITTMHAGVEPEIGYVEACA